METVPIKKKVELEIELDTTSKNKDGNKFESLMEFADVLDAYRIFPRAFISTYMYVLIETIHWFMTLSEPNASQAGLISVVVGAGAAWFGLYTASGSARNIKNQTGNK